MSDTESDSLTGRPCRRNRFPAGSAGTAGHRTRPSPPRTALNKPAPASPACLHGRPSVLMVASQARPTRIASPSRRDPRRSPWPGRAGWRRCSVSAASSSASKIVRRSSISMASRPSKRASRSTRGVRGMSTRPRPTGTLGQKAKVLGSPRCACTSLRCTASAHGANTSMARSTSSSMRRLFAVSRQTPSAGLPTALINSTSSSANRSAWFSTASTNPRSPASSAARTSRGRPAAEARTPIRSATSAAAPLNPWAP